MTCDNRGNNKHVFKWQFFVFLINKKILDLPHSLKTCATCLAIFNSQFPQQQNCRVATGN